MSDALRISVVLVMGVIVFACGVADGVPDINIKTVGCNSGEYTASDPFAMSLSSVLADLISRTSTYKGYDYSNISPYPNAFAYGHAACSKNLTAADCSTCLGAALTALVGQCQNCIGARAVIHDCTIRYEQYPFNDWQLS